MQRNAMDSWLGVVLICVWCSSGVLSQSVPLDPDGAHVCVGHVQYTSQRQISTIIWSSQGYKTCSLFGLWGGCFLWSSKTSYRLVTRVSTKYVSYLSSREENVCCRGWSKQGTECTVPVCASPCIHGDCIAPNICRCHTGYDGPTCNIDINECDTNNGECDHTCHNENGGFRCSCYQGYEKSSINPKRCNDINECLTNDRSCYCVGGGTCTATCLNLVGNYTCQCSTGYYTTDNKVCQDLNECQNNNGDCSHNCINEAGSHRCECPTGYQLQGDQKTCADIDECAVQNGGCSHDCTNNNGSFTCSCQTGYFLDANQRGCVDHDECANTDHGCQYKCENVQGSFVCSCHKGFELNTDNRTCSDTNECEILSIAPDGNNVTRGGCSYGCQNTNGSYLCTCKPGWVLLSDGKTCIDYDECLLSSVKLCAEKCVNTIGSYRCVCRDGYKVASNKRDCVGEPCQDLPPLLNGNSTCLKGITEEQCSFHCNKGFTMTGSVTRQCKPDHKWSGTPTSCERKSCQQLNPPLYATLQLPCDHRYNSTCFLKCEHGYYSTSTDLTSTCKLNESNSQLEWTNRQIKCLPSSPCQPNKCRNKGICVNVRNKKSVCNCQGTGYTGSTCEQGLISVPEIVVLRWEDEETMEITTRMSSVIGVQIESNDTRGVEVSGPTNITLNTKTNFKIISHNPGYYTLKYRISADGDKSTLMKQPKDTIVYVMSNPNQPVVKSLVTPTTFSGDLKPGCYNLVLNGMTYKSNMKFSNFNGTKGILQVMSYGGEMLPLSVSGGQFNVEESVFKEIPLETTLSGTYTKNSPTSNSQQCFENGDPEFYLPDVLTTKAFLLTIEQIFNKKTPYWFQLYVDDFLLSTTKELTDLTSSLHKGSQLIHSPTPCTLNMPLDSDSYYYIHQTKEELQLLFPTKIVKLSPNFMKCMVYNLKDGSIYFTTLTNDAATIREISQQIHEPFSTITSTVERIGFLLAGNQDKMITIGIEEHRLGEQKLYADLKLHGKIDRLFSNISNVYDKDSVVQLQSKGATAIINLNLETLGSKQNVFIKGQFENLSMQNMKTSSDICGAGNLLSGKLNQTSMTLPQPLKTIFKFDEASLLDILIREEISQPNVSSDTRNLFGALQYLMNDLNLKLSLIRKISLLDNTLKKQRDELIALLDGAVVDLNALQSISTTVKPNQLRRSTVQIRTKFVEAQQRFIVLERQYLKQYPSSKLVTELLVAFNSLFKQYLNALVGYSISYSTPNKKIKLLNLSGTGKICVSPNSCYEGGKITMSTGENINECSPLAVNVPSESTILLYEFAQEATIGHIFKVNPGSKLQITMQSNSNEYQQHFQGRWKFFENGKVSTVNIQENGHIVINDRALIFGDFANIKLLGDINDSFGKFQITGHFNDGSKIANEIQQVLQDLLKTKKTSFTERDARLSGDIVKAENTLQQHGEIHRSELDKEQKIQEQLTNLTAEIETKTKAVQNARQQIQDALSNDLDGSSTHFVRDCANGPNYCTSFCLAEITSSDCSLEQNLFYVEQSCKDTYFNRERVVISDTFNNESYVGSENKVECFNECPPLLAVDQPASNVSTHQSELGHCFRVCKEVSVPVQKFFSRIENRKRQDLFNTTTKVCSNILKQHLPSPKESLICFQSRVCVLEPHPLCSSRVQQCSKKANVFSSSNNAFRTAFETYTKEQKTLDILQTQERALKKVSRRQTIITRYSNETVGMAKESLANLQSNLQSFSTMTSSQIPKIEDSTKTENFKISNITFSFEYITGMQYPNLLELSISFKCIDEVLSKQVTSMYNNNKRNESIYDAAKELLDVVLGERKNELNGISSTPSQTEKKCFGIESSTVFLTNFIILIQSQVSDYQQKQTTFNMDTSDVTSNNNKLLSEVQSHQNQGENEEDLKILDQFLKQLIPKFARWNDTFSNFLLQYSNNMKIHSQCFSPGDCINHHLQRINEILQHSNTGNAGTFQQSYLDLTKTFNRFLYEPIDLATIKSMAKAAYQKLLNHDAVSLFCGTKPQITTPLQGEISIAKGDVLSTRIDVTNKQFDFEVSWLRDQQFIPGAYGVLFQKAASIVDDAGWYSCQIRNKFGTTDCGILKVNILQKPQIHSPPQSIDVYQKSPRKLKYLICNVTNSNQVQWLYHTYGEKSGFTRLSSVQNWLLVSSNAIARQSGFYWCEARNQGFTVSSEKARLNRQRTTIAIEQLLISFSMQPTPSRRRKSIDLKQARRKKRQLPGPLSISAKDSLLVFLAQTLNLREEDIKDLKYAKVSEDLAKVFFLIEGKDLMTELDKASSWDQLTDTFIENRRSLLSKPIALDTKSTSTNILTVTLNSQSLSIVPDSILISASKFKCQLGYGLLANGFTCGECPPGARSNIDNKCQPCAKNTYQSRAGQMECLSCPSSKITDGTNSISINDCKVPGQTTPTTVITSPSSPPTTLIPTTTEKLTKQPGAAVDDEGKEKDSSIIIIVVVIAVLVMIIVFIIFLVMRRRRSRNEKKRIEFSTSHINPTFHTDETGNEDGQSPYARIPFQEELGSEPTYTIPEKNFNKSTKSTKRLIAENNHYDYDNRPEVPTTLTRPKSLPYEKQSVDVGKNRPPIPPRAEPNIYDSATPVNETDSELHQKAEPYTLDSALNNQFDKNSKTSHRRSEPNVYDTTLPRKSEPNAYDIAIHKQSDPSASQKQPTSADDWEKPPVPERKRSRQSRSSVPRSMANQYESIDEFPLGFNNFAYDKNDITIATNETDNNYDHLNRKD